MMADLPLLHMAARVHAQADDLLANPTIAGCDDLLRTLTDTATALHRFRTKLERGNADGTP